MDVLYHVYSESYGFGFEKKMDPLHLKNKISDPQDILTEDTIALLFKKGSKISTSTTNRMFYFSRSAFFFWLGTSK